MGDTQLFLYFNESLVQTFNSDQTPNDLRTKYKYEEFKPNRIIF